MNISKLKECVFITLKANLTPFIQGSPGLGKSAIVREIAEELHFYHLMYSLLRVMKYLRDIRVGYCS